LLYALLLKLMPMLDHDALRAAHGRDLCSAGAVQ